MKSGWATRLKLWSLNMFDPTIKGHPEIVQANAADNPVSITVCSSCGKMRTILWLDGDRWYCNNCRVEGSTRPKMFPIK